MHTYMWKKSHIYTQAYGTLFNKDSRWGSKMFLSERCKRFRIVSHLLDCKICHAMYCKREHNQYTEVNQEWIQSACMSSVFLLLCAVCIQSQLFQFHLIYISISYFFSRFSQLILPQIIMKRSYKYLPWLESSDFGNVA